MKITTKIDFNFNKLNESYIKSSISNDIINFLVLDAKSRIQKGIDGGYDINGIQFEPNAFKYAEKYKVPGSPVMFNTGKLFHSLEHIFASTSSKSAYLGSNISYGEDHFEDRIGLGGKNIPARLWFYTTDNLGTETDKFLMQYGTVLNELNSVSQKNFFPKFLKKLKTSFRII